MFTLSILNGDDQGKRFELNDDQAEMIGREVGHLRLHDTRVSRQHCKIEPEDGLWLIHDLGSSNGTFVNGHQITRPTELNDGDQLQVGRLLIEVSGIGADVDVDTDAGTGAGDGVTGGDDDIESSKPTDQGPPQPEPEALRAQEPAAVRGAPALEDQPDSEAEPEAEEEAGAEPDSEAQATPESEVEPESGVGLEPEPVADAELDSTGESTAGGNSADASDALAREDRTEPVADSNQPTEPVVLELDDAAQAQARQGADANHVNHGSEAEAKAKAESDEAESDEDEEAISPYAGVMDSGESWEFAEMTDAPASSVPESDEEDDSIELDESAQSTKPTSKSDAESDSTDTDSTNGASARDDESTTTTDDDALRFIDEALAELDAETPTTTPDSPAASATDPLTDSSDIVATPRSSEPASSIESSDQHASAQDSSAQDAREHRRQHTEARSGAEREARRGFEQQASRRAEANARRKAAERAAPHAASNRGLPHVDPGQARSSADRRARQTQEPDDVEDAPRLAADAFDNDTEAADEADQLASEGKPSIRPDSPGAGQPTASERPGSPPSTTQDHEQEQAPPSADIQPASDSPAHALDAETLALTTDQDSGDPATATADLDAQADLSNIDEDDSDQDPIKGDAPHQSSNDESSIDDQAVDPVDENSPQPGESNPSNRQRVAKLGRAIGMICLALTIGAALWFGGLRSVFVEPPVTGQSASSVSPHAEVPNASVNSSASAATPDQPNQQATRDGNSPAMAASARDAKSSNASQAPDSPTPRSSAQTTPASDARPPMPGSLAKSRETASPEAANAFAKSPGLRGRSVLSGRMRSKPSTDQSTSAPPVPSASRGSQNTWADAEAETPSHASAIPSTGDRGSVANANSNPAKAQLNAHAAFHGKPDSGSSQDQAQEANVGSSTRQTTGPANRQPLSGLALRRLSWTPTELVGSDGEAGSINPTAWAHRGKVNADDATNKAKPAAGPPQAGQGVSAKPQTPLAAVPRAGRVAFLLDASGSMVDTMPAMLDWFDKALAKLSPDQQFTVIFFRRGQAEQAVAPGLRQASAEAKSAVRQWMRPEADHVHAAGRSGIKKAINAALSYDVQTIYLLADDDFAQTKAEAKPHAKTLANRVTSALAQKNITVHTVQFLYKDPSHTLNKIAQRFSGRHRFVRPSPTQPLDQSNLLTNSALP